MDARRRFIEWSLDHPVRGALAQAAATGVLVGVILWALGTEGSLWGTIGAYTFLGGPLIALAFWWILRRRAVSEGRRPKT